MKIIIPVLGMGRSGGERVLSKIATELVTQGNDVYFVTIKSDLPPYYNTSANIIFCERSERINKISRFIENCYGIWRKCRELDGDIVVANYHITAYIAAFLLTKKQRFYYIQAYEVLFYKRPLFKLVALMTYLLPFNKIVNSKVLLPEIINNYSAVVPAGIDYELFYDSVLPDIDGVINVGIVGRKEPYKGTKEILQVLANFIEENHLSDKVNVNVAVHMPDMHFTIKNMMYHSVENDADLASFYKLNDIFIATGLIEDGAFHYPCAEAMAAGCLVISNYAPLSNTSSELKITHFSEEGIISGINKCLTMNRHDIQREVLVNQSIIKNLSWNIIGKKMNDVLHHHIG